MPFECTPRKATAADLAASGITLGDFVMEISRSAEATSLSYAVELAGYLFKFFAARGCLPPGFVPHPRLRLSGKSLRSSSGSAAPKTGS